MIFLSYRIFTSVLLIDAVHKEAFDNKRQILVIAPNPARYNVLLTLDDRNVCNNTILLSAIPKSTDVVAITISRILIRAVNAVHTINACILLDASQRMDKHAILVAECAIHKHVASARCLGIYLQLNLVWHLGDS